MERKGNEIKKVVMTGGSGPIGLALIQKIPTPITPIKMDKESRQITLAFF